MKSLSAKVLFALVLGFAVGIGASMSGSHGFARAVSWLEPVGTLWINAIRMTVIPLIVGAIITGIAASTELKAVGRLGGRALFLFFLLLLAAATYSVLIAAPALSFLRLSADAADALRAGAAQASASALEGAQNIQSLRQWLVDLVPVNPIKAAADGAMLPLIVFAIAFGLAMTRVTPPLKETFLSGARAVTDAMLILVHWVLAAAPVGVFALSAAIALKLGIAAAGAVIFYIALVSLMCVAFMLLLYAMVWLTTRRGTFVRVWAQAQAVAFSSRSSLVALPAMIEGSATLGQQVAIRSFFLPLAVATFRIGAAINIPVGVLFLARLYGVDVSAAQLATIALTSVVTTFSVPGIPGGSIIVMVPVLLAAGLPVEGIGILLGVDTLPDMFRTTTNVTGDLAVASLLDQDEARRMTAQAMREPAFPAGSLL